MTWQARARTGLFLVLSVVAIGGLAGCDYWPPALQSQIEQLRSEVQMATAERARLENQVKDAVKSRDELQVRVDEMTRINRELTTRVGNLEAVIMTEREKQAKSAKPAQKTPTKAMAKKSPKAPVKKKTHATAKRH